MADKKEKRCSLCNTPASELDIQMIEGMKGMICKNCNDKCTDIFAAAGKGKGQGKLDKKIVPPTALKVPSPKEIKKFLDQYVVGQEHTKIVMSVAVHQHYSRITKVHSLSENHPLKDVELTKSNILMTGPSGTGKTLIAQTLARFLQVPFSMADCTTMTEFGYVGSDVDVAIQSLYQAAGSDIGQTQIGIVYLDEVDKLAKKGENMSITRDVSGEGVQQALLRLIEGSVINMALGCGTRKHPQVETVPIDTKNILFICGGAFVGLDDIIKQRMQGKGIIGFGNDIIKDSIGKAQPQDFIKFGLIPEFVGRLAVVTTLSSLSENDLVHVLTQPKNALVKQYQKMVAIEGAELIIEDSSIREMARLAVIKGTGARALRSVFEDLMLPVLFDLQPNSRIIITKDMVLEAVNGKGEKAA